MREGNAVAGAAEEEWDGAARRGNMAEARPQRRVYPATWKCGEIHEAAAKALEWAACGGVRARGDLHRGDSVRMAEVTAARQQGRQGRRCGGGSWRKRSRGRNRSKRGQAQQQLTAAREAEAGRGAGRRGRMPLRRSGRLAVQRVGGDGRLEAHLQRRRVEARWRRSRRLGRPAGAARCRNQARRRLGNPSGRHLRRGANQAAGVATGEGEVRDPDGGSCRW